MTEGTTAGWISGFWRRIVAFVADMTILAIVGLVLGLLLEKQFVQLGSWGRFVGFFIAFFYFGILNSKIFDGQTVGKKLLYIRVVNDNNETITLFRSFARYSVLGVPFFLNGAQFTNEATPFLLYPISLIIFGGFLSITYLYIFNRVTRQSLHDLAVGTYVVNVDAEKHSVGPVWRPHLIVVGTLFLASALVPVFTSNVTQNEKFKDLISAQAALNEHRSVTYVAVSSGTTTRTSPGEGTKTTTYLSARAFLEDNSVSDAVLAEQLAKVLAASHPGAQQMDVIQIILTYGYDIGIASKWTSYSHAFHPTDLIIEY